MASLRAAFSRRSRARAAFSAAVSTVVAVGGGVVSVGIVAVRPVVLSSTSGALAEFVGASDDVRFIASAVPAPTRKTAKMPASAKRRPRLPWDRSNALASKRSRRD